MNLVAFAIVIITLLALCLIASVVMLVLERKLERALVKKGHPADAGKETVVSVFDKKKDDTADKK